MVDGMRMLVMSAVQREAALDDAMRTKDGSSPQI